MENTHYNKIWLRLIGVFGLLVTLPVAILVWVTTASLREAAVDKIEVSLGRLTEHKKDVVTLFLKEKEELLTMLVDMYSITHLGDQENLDNIFIAVNKAGGIVDLQVIDASGNQLAYVGPYVQSLIGKNYRDAQWFQDVLSNGSHVSDVFLGFRNVPHFIVAVADPKKSYVLRATINSEQFNKLLLATQIGSHGDSFIVNQDGTLQTPSRAGLTELKAEDRSYLQYHEGTASHIGAEEVIATRWVKDGQWCVFVKTEIEDSLGPFYKVRNRILGVVVATSFMFFVGAVIFAKFLIRHMEAEDRTRTEMGHQIVQMEKMATVGRLAAGIAHEINNPLQMITSQAGWIKELLSDENPELVKNFEDYQKSVEQIKHHVRRAGTITHRLLGFSRKISAEKQNVMVNDLLEETLSFVENEAEYQEIQLTKKYAENLPGTMTDGPQLQQVFLNLINNAIDEVGHGGIIELRTALVGTTKILIEIADNGPGIKPENLKRIFDPFFTTKDPGKGTGLGLYISYDIVKKLGGTITVANKEKGGAVFTIILPIVIPA